MTPRDSPVGRAANERIDRRDDLELLADDEKQTWTVVPVDATGEERLTRWLTVDADLLCELEAWR